ncbi:MAG: NADH-quinone oxidoreductase subunit NuoB [Chloroflexi bacterium]|uniref:NADH-quinone oxidoreductase subunit B n=1 Tax=Candidatus Flexifilum breve TaxID=3140694 RepID=UPI003135B159|nr:NADH-quinone oxidoreductase subunit NuoB [Chloroflexota bacterium]
MSQIDLRELQSTEFPVPTELQDNVAITSLSRIYNWSRRNSMWPLLFGLACCAIEMICTAASRYDLARFGMEVMRASPRQADLMIVSGTVTKKMVVPIVRLYNQMPEPKYVLAMGACASGGGPFKEGYNVVSGIDQYLPVDVYMPGCPPTPQALMFGLISLQQRIDGQSLMDMDDIPWYGVGPSDPVPVPILGPDVIDPRQMELIRQQAQAAAAGLPFGARELPKAAVDVVEKAKKVAAAAKPAAAPAVAAPKAADAADDPEKAERLRKREEALARKRAAQGKSE